MSFRKKGMIHIAVLGTLLAIQQVLLSTNYDLIKTVYSNSTLPGAKSTRVNVFGSAYNEDVWLDSTRIASQSVKTSGHEGHNGFELAVAAYNVCSTQHISSPGTMKAIHAVPNRGVLYCPMEKIATTFWRRVFYMLVQKKSTKYKQPYEVPISQALGQARSFTHSLTSKSGNLSAKSSFSFLFVRNPYSRLLSAYIDKLVPPNPRYWKAWGVKAITMFRPKNVPRQLHVVNGNILGGHDVTFAEFLKFAAVSEKSSEKVDGHIISINKGCKPCTYSYTYIGRMESFKNDTLFIMKKLQMNKTLEVMEESFSDLSVDDAITDSIRSPFSWKKDVVKFISWEKALQRIWLKLQMRGIIENKIKLAISKDAVDKTSVNGFIEMARKAHRGSDPVALKKQKDMIKREAFASVSLTDIRIFRETFKEDFALFGYDPSPSYMFDRTDEPLTPTIFFNYSHLN